MTEKLWVDIEKGGGWIPQRKLCTLNRILLYILICLCILTAVVTVRRSSVHSHYLMVSDPHANQEPFIIDSRLHKARNSQRVPYDTEYNVVVNAADAKLKKPERSPAVPVKRNPVVLHKEVEAITLVSKLVLVVDSLNRKYESLARNLWGEPLLMNLSKHPYNDALKDYMVDYFKVEKLPILLVNGKPMVSSIPSRKLIVNFYASDKAKEKGKPFNAFAVCALSNEKLNRPVVSDYRGQLFNKDTLLEFLLNKEYLKNEKLGHITSLKDVVELNIKLDENKLKCELTSSEYDIMSNVLPKFAYVVPCGCVMLKNNLLSLLSSTKPGEYATTRCPICNTEFFSRDVIEIEPDEDELRVLEKRMKLLETEGLHHSLKARKKRKSVSGEKSAKRSKIKSAKP
ncbi:hypothetical protein KL918_004379 [Ogataea parapolymorpha]|nr:hypothetical protein KL918_004379 [Ogataea parapolymorpha]KAG7873628.1 hypothetical protein KL916_002232 [Ogataea parapolymorpha]